MSSKPYVVVVGTDYSEHAVRALAVAYDEASRHAPAELHVVHASLAACGDESGATAARFGYGRSPVLSLEEQREQLARHLDEQLVKLEGFPRADVKVRRHVVLDAPPVAVVSLASEVGASLIVVGTHGLHGLARWILGSVAEAVVRRAECPVLVVPPPAEPLGAPRALPFPQTRRET